MGHHLSKCLRSEGLGPEDECGPLRAGSILFVPGEEFPEMSEALFGVINLHSVLLKTLLHDVLAFFRDRLKFEAFGVKAGFHTEALMEGVQ